MRLLSAKLKGVADTPVSSPVAYELYGWAFKLEYEKLLLTCQGQKYELLRRECRVMKSQARIYIMALLL